jgi:Tol biopolymer transport system component
VVAFVRDGVLMVAPLDGGTNRVAVAEKVQGVYDWTPDGKSLVYAVRLTENESPDINLSRIERRGVIDGTGALVAGDILPLALNGSGFTPRVRCLPNGRVLFSGFQQQLPAPALAARESRFFLIDPSLGTNAVPLAIPSAPSALPQELAYFAPSPDGRQIAIVESGSDVVALLDVTTGALEVVSPKRGGKSRALPAWRGNDELYLAALPQPGSARPELLRWHRGSASQVFSSSWPDEVVTGLVEKPK